MQKIVVDCDVRSGLIFVFVRLNVLRQSISTTRCWWRSGRPYASRSRRGARDARSHLDARASPSRTPAEAAAIRGHGGGVTLLVRLLTKLWCCSVTMLITRNERNVTR